MASVLVPIFVCVVLPVSIVYIVFRAAVNGDNKRAQVLLKAIETNNNIDADKLAEALQRPRKSARQLLNLRLLRGCLFTLLGLFLLVAGLITYSLGTPFIADSVYVPFIFGGASMAIGASFLIVFFVTRKQVSDHEGK